MHTTYSCLVIWSKMFFVRSIIHFLKLKDLVGATEDSSDVISKDGKLVLDFLQAIHTAEKRQAELDAHIFAEEKRKIKV